MLHFLSIPNLIWWYKRGMTINFDIKKIIKGRVLGDQPFIFSLFDDNALLDPVFTFVFKGFIFSNFRVCYLKCLGFFFFISLGNFDMEGFKDLTIFTLFLVMCLFSSLQKQPSLFAPRH